MERYPSEMPLLRKGINQRRNGREQMSGLANEKWTVFKQLWASNFKNLTEADGILYWQNFVEKCQYWSILEEAVALLSDRYRRQKENDSYAQMPKLPELKNLYFALINKELQAGQSKDASSYICPHCRNCGYVTIVADTKKPVYESICDPRKPCPSETVSVMAGPCICNRDQRYPDGFRKKCVGNSFGPADGGTGNERDYIGKCLSLYNQQQERLNEIETRPEESNPQVEQRPSEESNPFKEIVAEIQ
jgi:hypothetical protein